MADIVSLTGSLKIQTCEYHSYLFVLYGLCGWCRRPVLAIMESVGLRGTAGVHALGQLLVGFYRFGLVTLLGIAGMHALGQGTGTVYIRA